MYFIGQKTYIGIQPKDHLSALFIIPIPIR